MEDGGKRKKKTRIKNRILPNLAKNLKQTLLCTSTVYMFAFLSFKVVVVWCGVV
jgi:hypothetical protein